MYSRDQPGRYCKSHRCQYLSEAVSISVLSKNLGRRTLFYEKIAVALGALKSFPQLFWSVRTGSHTTRPDNGAPQKQSETRARDVTYRVATFAADRAEDSTESFRHGRHTRLANPSNS